MYIYTYYIYVYILYIYIYLCIHMSTKLAIDLSTYLSLDSSWPSSAGCDEATEPRMAASND